MRAASRCLSLGLLVALGACSGGDDGDKVDDSAVERVETSCTNNQDDDVDGLIDCDDDDCAADPVCLAPDTETSCEDGVDEDLDTLTDCDDPDCAARCTPHCPPGATCADTLPRCGDGVCNAALEDTALCPGDCP